MSEAGSGERIGRAGALAAKSLVGRLLSWFGIVGGAFSVFSNVSGFFSFAYWVRDLVEHWRLIVGSITRYIVDLLPLPFSIPDHLLPFLALTIFLLSMAIGARLSASALHYPLRAALGQTPRYLGLILTLALIVWGLVTVLRHLVLNNFQLDQVQATGIVVATIVAPYIWATEWIGRVLDRRWPDTSQQIKGATDVLFSVAVVCYLATGQTTITLFFYCTILSPLILLIVPPDRLAERCWTVVLVAASFFAVAALTMLPVPPDLAISGFFDRA